jgi:hypothetical protein
MPCGAKLRGGLPPAPQDRDLLDVEHDFYQWVRMIARHFGDCSTIWYHLGDCLPEHRPN